MKTIDKIRELLQLSTERKFYAEARLDDGRMICTEAEKLEVGVEVYVMTEEGTKEEIDNGEYAYEDGTKLLVEGGRIKQIGDAATDVAEEAIEELAEEFPESSAEKADWAKTYEDLKDQVKNLEVAVHRIQEALGEKMEEETAEEIAEEDMSATMEAMAQITAENFSDLVSRLDALENAPASEGVKTSPTNLSTQHKSVDLSKFNAVDRALLTINSHR